MKARFLALAALVLGLASCQQEFNGAAQLGGEVDFQLKVDAAELATRAGVDGVDDENNAANSAFGAIDYLQGVTRDNVSRYDWNDVDLRYSLEVYDAGADYSNTTDVKPVKDRMVKIVDQYEPVVFDLRLVPGRNYHFVVFADFVPQGATVESTEGVAFTEHQSTLGIHHTIGSDLRSIQIKDDAINDERCDAYFATTEVAVKHQALTSGDIVLQRPYGKLRVIATDLAELNLNVDPAWVEVTYTAQHPQHFNAVTGDVTAFVDGNYGFSSTYNELFKDVEKGGLKKHFYGAGYDNAKYYSTVNADGVKRHTHMTLFTDYILGSNTLGEQTPVQFTMTVYDKANNPIKTTQFNTTIPIERNHLTTIVGNVLTSATEITVTIDDNFANADDELTNNDYYQVVATDGYELVKAAMEQYKVILDGGVDENGDKRPITLTIKDFEKYFAERNTRAGQTGENTYSFPNGTEIDLNGYTLIIENNSDEPLIVVEGNNTLNIVDNSDENKGEVILRGEGDGAAIENNGTLNIEGVELESEKPNGSVIDNNGEANIVDSTLNNGALTNNAEAEANIAGSDLNAGSVENNGMTNVNGGTVNEGAIDNGDDATVGSYIKDHIGLQAAIDAAVVGTDNEFTLDADIVGDVTINQKDGVNITINGNGKKFDGTIFVDGKNRHNGEETLVIKNVKFETSTTAAETKYFIKGLTAGNSYPHNITITDCSFESTVAKNYNVAGIWFQQFFKLDVINCSAKNLHSLLQTQSCDNYVNVEKAKIQACKNGISFGNTANATFKDSYINAVEYGVRGDGNASRGNLVIENSKIEAATPVIIRKMTSDGYKVSMNGTKTLNKKSGFYHVVFTNGDDDEAYAAPTGKFEYTGFDADWVVFPYTWEVKSKAEFDQALASPATSKITFGSDITDNLTVVQKPGVKLTIDGANHKFNGYIKVHSNSYHYADAALTIENVKFETSTASLNFIEALENGSQRYSTNITVKDCTFTATGAAADTAVGLQIKASKWAKAINCTATGLHSLVQAQSCDTTVDVIGCNINGKNGVAFKQVKAAKVEGTTIEAREYGIRFDGNIDNYGIVAKDNNITAAQPFIVRKMTGKDNTIALEGQNTLTSTREVYQIVITNGSDDVAYAAPTGTYTLTGADGFIVYPDTVVVADGLLKKENTYLVTNANGLVALSGMTIKGYEIVTLGADIDLTGVEFNGLNAFNPETPNTFDGQGHTVSNWTNNSGASDMGFIRNWVGPIKNVKFEKCHLKTSGRSAIAAGKVYGNIEKVTINDCTIEDSYWACGLVAGHYNSGSISNCTVTNSSVKSNGGTGGIVGVINESAGIRKVENCKVENCTINNTGAYGEDYSGALICGMINISNSTVEFNDCSYKNNTKQGDYVGDLYYNAGADITIKIDGAVYAWTELKDILATTYKGEVFESGYMENALWFNNYVFSGDAAIVIEDKTYNAIILENSVGEFKNDVITINNNNSSVMILQNLNLTLAEGKKLIKAANKTYQVFMANITINGENMTTESMAKYLENVEWYQVVEEI